MIGPVTPRRVARLLLSILTLVKAFVLCNMINFSLSSVLLVLLCCCYS